MSKHTSNPHSNEAESGGAIEREVGIAIELARAAGARALEFYGARGLHVEHKGFDEPVTEADYAANRIIVEGLTTRFPTDGLLSEEKFDEAGARLKLSRTWIVDPIDGTQGFIDGTGDFAIQIGLAERGRPTLGVVYLPASDTLYYAARGAGAWRQSNINASPEQLRTSDTTDFRQMRLAASRSHRSPRMNLVVERFGFCDEVNRGSVGVKVGLVADRACDLYIHLSPRTKHWDTCAPEAILIEAGGTFTDLFGQPLRYQSTDVRNSNGIVATNGAAHDKVIKTLQPLLAEFGRTPVENA